MKRTIIILCILLASLSITGCGSLLNPFHEKFDCQASGKGGKCADTDTVYKDLRVTLTQTGDNKTLPNTIVLDTPEQKIPLLKQPEVIRILILPYVSNGKLNMGRYVYMADKEPRWNIQ